MNILVSPISVNFGDPFLFKNNTDSIDKQFILYQDLWFCNITVTKKKKKNKINDKILSYRQKRKRRNYGKHTRYISRSKFAIKRPRIKGRFIKMS